MKVLLMLMLSVTVLFAQGQVSVSGSIVDKSNGSALPGVNVLVKGTTNGTITDFDGKYTLNVADANATILISFIGYRTQEVALNGQTKIDINLEVDYSDLDEVVIIGYGTQKKSDLTGSIAIVEADEMAKSATNDVSKALQGKVPGVSIQGSGEPGAAPKVKIRGIGSFGNNEPLYIVDGIFTPINDLPMSSIESVQVLKDASASAIYGSRAANGVIIITTKRGKKGKIKVDYSGYSGVQNITKRFDVTNREQYQMLVNEATTNAMQYDASLYIVPANDPNSASYVKDIDSDWQDAVFKQGKITDHSVSVSGGNDMSTFSVNLNYFDQQGTVVGRGPNYTRYGISVNSDHKAGKFKFGESVHYTYADQDLMSFLHDGTMMNYTILAIPTVPVFDANTADGYGAASNDIHNSYTANVVGMNSMIKSQTARHRFIGNVYGQYDILPSLKYKVSLSYERTDWKDFHFKPTHGFGWFYENSIAKMDDNRGSSFTGTFEQTLTFQKKIGDLDLTAMAGQSALNTVMDRNYGHAEGFSKPYYEMLSNGETTSARSDRFESRLASLFGRAILNYKDKYLLTATIRRDGSSRFSPDKRWGSFPSVAAAWKVSEESFMEPVSAVVSQFKIRASYGILGNQNIADYLYQGYVNPYANYVLNGQLAPGASQYIPSSPTIQWETSYSTNVGFDLGFYEGKFTVTGDYFIKKTEDLLYAVPTPTHLGWYDWESPTVNGLSVENKGVELSTTFSDNVGEFKYSIGANVSTLQNKVLSLGYGSNPIYGAMSRTDEGREIGEFYGWQVDKVFQSQTEIDELNAASPNGFYQELQTAPGDFKFKDLNGDGFINEEDRTFLGKAIPNLYYGFNFSAGYKAFDFSLSAQGASGNMVNNSIRRSLESGSGWENLSTDVLDRWTPDNTGTGRPRIIIDDPNGNNRDSEYWLEDGSYLRISNIEIGYTLPTVIISKFKIAAFRIYGSVQNAMTFTKYSGLDPEFNNDGLFSRGTDQGAAANKSFTDYAGGLPTPRTVMFGVKVSF